MAPSSRHALFYTPTIRAIVDTNISSCRVVGHFWKKASDCPWVRNKIQAKRPSPSKPHLLDSLEFLQHGLPVECTIRRRAVHTYSSLLCRRSDDRMVHHSTGRRWVVAMISARAWFHRLGASILSGYYNLKATIHPDNAAAGGC
jgi:hypothetical protein